MKYSKLIIIERFNVYDYLDDYFIWMFSFFSPSENSEKEPEISEKEVPAAAT